MSALGSVDQKPYNPAAKGNYPSAPIQQSAHCGQWGHLVNVIKYQGLLQEYLDLYYIANIQDTMGPMSNCMVSILDFVLG